MNIFNLHNPSSRDSALGVESASNINEYQESSWGVKCGPEREADNLTESRLPRTAMAHRRPAAWFTPSPAKSQVYFTKSYLHNCNGIEFSFS
jgi:hypothetical protein